MSALAEALESGLLHTERHAALLRNVDRVSRQANIPPYMLYRSMVGVCSKEEVDYIRALRRQADAGIFGLVVHGPRPSGPLMDRFGAIAAACLRNYINARLMTLQSVLEALDEGDFPRPTVLLVPNFYVGVKSGGKLAEWEIPKLLGMLYDRQSAGLQTVLYVQDFAGLSLAYGQACEQHTNSAHFVKAKAAFNNND